MLFLDIAGAGAGVASRGFVLLLVRGLLALRPWGLAVPLPELALEVGNASVGLVLEAVPWQPLERSGSVDAGSATPLARAFEQAMLVLQLCATKPAMYATRFLDVLGTAGSVPRFSCDNGEVLTFRRISAKRSTSSAVLQDKRAMLRHEGQSSNSSQNTWQLLAKLNALLRSSGINLE
jgi:hypothetical protein